MIRTEWNALQRQRDSPSKAGRGGIEERWEEREEVGAISLVPLAETRDLTPEDEREEESGGEERKMRRSWRGEKKKSCDLLAAGWTIT